MTEQQNNADTTPEEIKSVVDTTPLSEPTVKHNRSGTVGIALATLAIALSLAIAGGVYYHSKAQSSAQTAANTALINQLHILQQQQAMHQQEFSAQLAKQALVLQNALTQQTAFTQQIDDVQDKIATLSGSDAKAWLLAQADFLVKLAGRKLWSDQDVTTAAALLRTADASLSDMNDPSIIPVRRALTDDIDTLAKISQIDYDGIILKLSQLSNNIDNLRLADNDNEGSPMDSEDSELSGSLREWRQNLLKSWDSFMGSFITIRRRDETAIPLLAPNQDIYLRENIRSQLLIAAQAVPRHQQEIYKQSLETVSTWVRAYYNTNDTTTKTFLDELDKLIEQNINMDVPEMLQSQALLEKLVQTRVRHLFAQSQSIPITTEQNASPDIAVEPSFSPPIEPTIKNAEETVPVPAPTSNKGE